MSKRFHLVFIRAVTVMAFLLSPSALNAGIESPVVIGMVSDGPWYRNDEIMDMFKSEIIDLTRGEFDIRFPDKFAITGEFTIGSVRNGMNRLLEEPEVDMVIAMGVMASHLACQQEKLPKPVIAPFVLHTELQKIPTRNGKSGVENLCFLTFSTRMENDLEAFYEIVQYDKVYILMDDFIIREVIDPQAKLSRVSREGYPRFETEIIGTGDNAKDILDRIPHDARAVQVGTLLQLSERELEKLAEGLVKRKIPSFALFGKSCVEKGFFAGLATEPLFGRRARRVALNVQRILLGEKPEEIPYSFTQDERLVINMQTARAIGQYPSWAVITEAEMINQQRSEAEQLWTLTTAVKEAVRVNLDLLASQRGLASNKADVNKAWSTLLPQLELSGLGLIIDEDRAVASFGQQAEKTITGTISATQLIYSEPAFANISIQKKLHRSREAEYHALQLDIVYETATAYLNVLRANTYERIQKENLKQIRTNYELARIRESIGYSGPAEVYRWESEIASNRKTVIEASAGRNLTEMRLNTLLDRPPEENFFLAEVNLDYPDLFTSDGRLFAYAANPWSFKALRAFMVKQALENSPELKQLDEAISARRRMLISKANNFWSPTIALKAEMAETFYKDGAGEKSATTPEMPFDLPSADDNDWSIGISASFSLFSGGSKFVEYNQEREALRQLEFQRESAVNKIEQRIRSAMHQAGASNAGIQQAKAAADAAHKNLDLVRDAYSRGVVSIIELIDAQNAARVADEAAANAVYDFFIDYMEVGRASGQFDFFLTEREREQWFGKLEQFYREQGVELPEIK